LGATSSPGLCTVLFFINNSYKLLQYDLPFSSFDIKKSYNVHNSRSRRSAFNTAGKPCASPLLRCVYFCDGILRSTFSLLEFLSRVFFEELLLKGAMTNQKVPSLS